MYYVYVIQSTNNPDRCYVGFSSDLKKRMVKHNAGYSTYTAKYKPWKLVWYAAFYDKLKALDFEKYLKSHSGKAFISKHLA